MRRTRIAIAGALVAALAIAVPAGAAGPKAYDGSSTDGKAAARATVDNAYALVQLKGEPLSTYVKTKPAQGKKIDFASATVKSYKALLAARRNDFKKWLQKVAPKAQVVKGYDLSLNAVAVKLNGTSLATIRTSALVVRAEYEGLYYPTAEDPDLALISAPQAWAAGGGSSAAGTGIKVAIVDTGIDQTHPCFSDDGYATQTQLGNSNYTNNKVIVAKVFNMKTPSRGYTAEALQEHGTHVAGTVACNFGTAASVGGVLISHTISGVAPRALLGNYNIFPGDVLNAHSEDILNALDAAYADGMDVANMSIGGGAHGIQDLLGMAVDNLDRANMVVAVAAGNSGPGHFTVESPGSAARALTAGAATVGHFIATPVVTLSHGTFPAAAGDFATVSFNTSATLAAVAGTGANGLSTACSALPALIGKIALVSRGTCSFSAKIRNAQAAGAILVLVGNNSAGDPIAMGQDGTPSQPTIPAYMLSINDAGVVKLEDGNSVTVQAAKAYFISGNDDFMASFSSQGPTDVDFRVKPDVVAPGVNVLSSIPHQFCNTTVDIGGCFAFFQGTSMATPHLAGSAAVVLGQHPDWSPAQVRSAIVNTADQDVLKKSTSTAPETDVNIVGAGRENLLSAVNASVFLDSVSVSFGAVPSGSGQTRTFALSVTNTGAAATLAIAGTTGSGVTFTVSPSSVAADATAAVTVMARFNKGAAAGDYQALLTITAGGTEVAHAAVYAFVK